MDVMACNVVVTGVMHTLDFIRKYKCLYIEKYIL
jgi:hypothetical protein